MNANRIGFLGKIALTAAMVPAALGMGGQRTPLRLHYFGGANPYYQFCSPIQAFGSYLSPQFYNYMFAPNLLSSFLYQLPPQIVVTQQTAIQHREIYRPRFDKWGPPLQEKGEPSAAERLEQEVKTLREDMRRHDQEQSKGMEELKRLIEDLKRVQPMAGEEKPTTVTEMSHEQTRIYSIEFPYKGEVCDDQIVDSILRLYDQVFKAAKEESKGEVTRKAHFRGKNRAGRYMLDVGDEHDRRVHEIDITDLFGKNNRGPGVVNFALEKLSAQNVLKSYYAPTISKSELVFWDHSCGSYAK